MATDRAPYEVVWWPHPHHPGRIMARIPAYGVEVTGDTREQLDEQVRLAIRTGAVTRTPASGGGAGERYRERQRWAWSFREVVTRPPPDNFPTTSRMEKRE